MQSRNLNLDQARRVAGYFVNPGTSLRLPYVKDLLLEAIRTNKQALILHKGPDAVMKAMAGQVERVNNTGEHKLEVTFSNVKYATPLALVAFVSKNLVLAGETKITSQDLDDLFPQKPNFMSHHSLSGEIKAALFQKQLDSGLYEQEESKLTRQRFSLFGQRPRGVYLYTGNELFKGFNPAKNS